MGISSAGLFSILPLGESLNHNTVEFLDYVMIYSLSKKLKFEFILFVINLIW